MSSMYTERSSLLNTSISIGDDAEQPHTHPSRTAAEGRVRRNVLWSLVLLAAGVAVTRFLDALFLRAEEYDARAAAGAAGPVLASSRGGAGHGAPTAPRAAPAYTDVQTLSFQIYTGGAPAFTVDAATGDRSRNPECEGLHSYGLPADSSSLQCYLGLKDPAEDVRRRLAIMTDAVNRAYDVSSKDDATLKIFNAPEFYFRGVDGAFQFQTEEEEEDARGGGGSDIGRILRGLEDLVADPRFEHWLFLFGTVLASAALPTADAFDYQFYNFAPLYKGYDPRGRAGATPAGKHFLVPKRYVSNIDFLTPLRHLTNRSAALELLDEAPRTAADATTVLNPHAHGHKRYDNDVWVQYKDELTNLGYTMIEYGWFFMDGISFSVEICLDHLSRRALTTHLADAVTGAKTRVPSAARDALAWAPLPRHLAQISLVSSAGMEVTAAALALADGGHVFLQDGANGAVTPRTTYGEDECQPHDFEFFGGAQAVTRTAAVTATDVTFEYALDLAFADVDLYPATGTRRWRDALRGVFSGTAYPPRLTVYDPVRIAVVQ